MKNKIPIRLLRNPSRKTVEEKRGGVARNTHPLITRDVICNLSLFDWKCNYRIMIRFSELQSREAGEGQDTHLEDDGHNRGSLLRLLDTLSCHGSLVSPERFFICEAKANIRSVPRSFVSKPELLLFTDIVWQMETKILFRWSRRCSSGYQSQRK